MGGRDGAPSSYLPLHHATLHQQNNLDDVVSILDVRRMKVVSKHNFKQQASMKSLGIECVCGFATAVLF